MLGKFAQAIVENPQAAAQLTKGCTTKVEHGPGGFVSFKEDCQQSAGAPFTSSSTFAGTPDDMRQHTELALKGLGPNGGDTVVSDTHMTFLGACPANMKPGQMMKADGEILDPLTDPGGFTKGK